MIRSWAPEFAVNGLPLKSQINNVIFRQEAEQLSALQVSTRRAFDCHPVLGFQETRTAARSVLKS
jgi:hypothetical protein